MTFKDVRENVVEAGEALGEFSCLSADEMLALGEKLGEALFPGDVVLLRGELGAGKTVFAKGVAAARGICPEQVTSPSFTLMNVYRGRDVLCHIDLYRLDDAEGFERAGLLDVFGTNAIVIVEWPDRVEEVFRGMSRYDVQIDLPTKSSRRVKIKRINEGG